MYQYELQEKIRQDKRIANFQETGKRQAQAETGIPFPLKERFETISGVSFDDVKVHYNSGKPAQLQALAYTQGSRIYVGPGQEKHLAHELGHVLQQKQGIIRPTTTVAGLPVNDDPELELSADMPKPYGHILSQKTAGTIQLLAVNAPGAGSEQRADLTQADVRPSITAGTQQNDILDPMIRQRDWIQTYHQKITACFLLKDDLNAVFKQSIAQGIQAIRTQMQRISIHRGQFYGALNACYSALNPQPVQRLTAAYPAFPDTTQFLHFHGLANTAKLNVAPNIPGLTKTFLLVNANNFILHASRAVQEVNRLAIAIIADAIRNAQESLVSAVNLSRDLYEIRRELENDAIADAAVPAAAVAPTTGAQKLHVIDAVRNTVHLPALAGEERNTAAIAANFKAQVAGAQTATAGKQLIHMAKTQTNAVFSASLLAQDTKRIALLYKEAGDISNQSRMLAGDAQMKSSLLQELLPASGGAAPAALPAPGIPPAPAAPPAPVAPPALAAPPIPAALPHSPDPGTMERMKTPEQIAMSRPNLNPHMRPLPRHGPALAEVDMFIGHAANPSTVSRINDPLGRIPKKLHPRIAANLAAMGADGSASGSYQGYWKTKGAGSHAEVHAANKALIYSGITSLDEANRRLFGRIAHTYSPAMADTQTLFDPRTLDLPSFAQCPHCAAALQTLTPEIYKPKERYLEKCAYYIHLEIQSYAPRDDQSVWDCARSMMDILPANWNTRTLAQYLYGLTHFGGSPEKDEKNWIAAEHLSANVELKRYHDAYHH